MLIDIVLYERCSVKQVVLCLSQVVFLFISQPVVLITILPWQSYPTLRPPTRLLSTTNLVS